MTWMRRTLLRASRIWFALFLLSFSSFALLRMDAVADKSLESLLGIGLGHGLLLDAVVTALLICLFLLGSAFRAWLGVLLFWGAYIFAHLLTLGDLLYFRFFGSPLKMWVIRNHLSDIGVVGGSALSLGFRPLILFALVAFVMTLILSLRLYKTMDPRGSWRRGLAFAPVFVSAFFAHQYQFSLEAQRYLPSLYPPREVRIAGNLAAHNTVFKMLDELDPKKRERLEIGLSGGVSEAREVLSRFKIYGAGSQTQATLPYSPDDVAAWRRTLGLSPGRPPNFIVVFVESLRGYEFFHPDLGPKIYPRTHAILKKHGWLFSKTYSSSLTAGQTVRGVYESLCSAFPNMLGPAPHLAFPEQDIECIQKLLLKNSYQTAWMVPHLRDFHNKFAFEKKQGTQVMRDVDSFDPDSVQNRFELGIVDHEFFKLFADRLDQDLDTSKPFFVHTINVGTHHPWGPLTFQVPDSLHAQNKSHYEQFMSRLRYWDYSFGILFDELSKKSWMKDTVIVMLADHSMKDAPPAGLNPVQLEEINFRIPLAFITLGLKSRTIAMPVHHLDVAPTLAALAGVAAPPSYLGRNLMTASEGSPWVYTDGRQEVSYRAQGRSCYYLSSTRSRACYVNDARQDPLYSASDILIEDPEQTKFFEKVVAAEHMLHGLDAWTQVFK